MHKNYLMNQTNYSKGLHAFKGVNNNELPYLRKGKLEMKIQEDGSKLVLDAKPMFNEEVQEPPYLAFNSDTQGESLDGLLAFALIGTYVMQKITK